LEPDSVMEFGFNHNTNSNHNHQDSKPNTKPYANPKNFSDFVKY